MVGSISGVNPYYNYYQYGGYSRMRISAAERVQSVQPVQATTAVTPVRAISLDTPVPPVDAISRVRPGMSGNVIPFLREGADPAEMAVRMRMQQYDPEQKGVKIGLGNEKAGVDGVLEAAEKGECQTCAKRKYQDGSDDPGVSYQTPTHISPDQAASAVRGHEMEHVVREQAAAEKEDRRVLSQSVSLHTDICPECGKVYVSGGTTRTVTASDTQPKAKPEGQMQKTA